jgi:hypothetical protein
MDPLDEVGELRMTSLVGTGIFSMSGMEDVDERDLIGLPDRVEWMLKFTRGDDWSF